VKFLVCQQRNQECVGKYYKSILQTEEKINFETLSISFEEDLDHTSEQ
jgi:hypothetical protein